jgi:hypothetical protein
MMTRGSHTQAIRRAVENGGQVKALLAVGQSGEQSLNRIETAAPCLGR